MTKKLNLSALLLFAVTVSLGLVTKQDSTVLKKDSKNVAALKPHHGQPHWFRHSNNIGHCGHGGVYCLRKTLLTEFEFKNGNTLEEDETINEISIQLNKESIIIKSIGVKGQLSLKTIEAFKSKKVELLGGMLSQEVVNSLFKDIGLKAPKEGVQFTPEEQSYNVNSTSYDGKKVDIIEVLEKTMITIADKTYNLTVITTSGIGTNSPKN